MNIKTNCKDRYFYIALLAFPLYILIQGLIIKDRAGFFFLNRIDPEYAYLFNGLNLSRLKIVLGHIDHPGTPLQVFIAIVIRVVHLFRRGNLVDDVLLNPEIYLGTTNFILILLNASAIFLLGYVANKIFYNKYVSLFLQLTLIPFSLISLFSRTIPEVLLMFTSITLIIIFLLNFKYESEKRKFNLYIIYYSIIIGFGVATKITFFPIIFIPFFILNNWKDRIYYILFTIGSFFFFILPIIKQFNNFYDWIKALLLHNQKYGQGDLTIIDYSAFIPNLIKILKDDYLFSIVLFLITITFIYIILKPSIQRTKEKNYIIRLLFGFYVAGFLELIMVAKHYSSYYMTPILVFCISIFNFLLFFWADEFKKIFTKSIQNFILVIVSLTILFIECPNLFESYKSNKKKTFAQVQTIDFIRKNINKTTQIVNPFEYGCAYQEFGLLFGKMWSGSQQDYYVSRLKILYPNIYFQLTWNKTIYGWDRIYQMSEIFKKSTAFVYFENNDKTFINNGLDGINFYKSLYNMEVDTFYRNINSGEFILRLYNQNAKLKNNFEIVCDAETLTKDKMKFNTNVSGQYFTNAMTQSNEKAFSGIYCCKLYKDKAYGMSYKA